MKCPECGSKKLVKFGKRWVKNKAAGKKYQKQQYQCTKCGRLTIYPK